ncbi:Nucleotide-binding universal stress protein, UspA family [Marinococcus luteus]|uniref:Nucleotide-binding universal stress protein, UspA family n=1 Tax=Marinococcus luteus TaxID=1122204 RepID=A0A1H2QKU7_9BACI|nr:universal stress protein [Marinococcus luteus]SDW07833.1 Nucleotide-binding universal stress protein, UspA family [Marinococcus luteus]
MHTMNVILVAVDGSEEADYAFETALPIAKAQEAQLVITQVINRNAYRPMSSYDSTMIGNVEDEARRLLNKYKKQAEEFGLTDVVADLEYGSPKTAIPRDIVPKYHVDLIVTGATGLNAVEKLFLGSISEHITKNADCSVMVVRS